MKVMAYGRETQSFMKKGGQQKYLDKALPSGSPKQTSTKHFFFSPYGEQNTLTQRSISFDTLP